MSMEQSQATTENEKVNVVEQIEVNDESPQSSPKKRKLTSDVWKDFTKIIVLNGEDKAKCNHCKGMFVGESSKGTSHLRKHLRSCNAKKYKDVKQQMLSVVKGTSDFGPKLQTFKFDQERSRMDLAKMIIKHNYPFNMVEHEFFETFCNNLQPMFRLVSRNTIRADVLTLYRQEKDKLYNFLDNMNCKITLTTDLWTSEHQNFAYICLTAHYINDDWDLKKKILAYKYIEYPHDGETLFRFVSDLILEWNLDKKLFSMVVDNASSNDVMVRLLKNWLCDRSLLLSSGDFFHVRCSAHILNLIVQDGLKMIGGVLNKIRDSVRYLNRSPYGKQKFDSAMSQVKWKGRKNVPMDVQNRWNSTFLMLEAAVPLKEAFGRLEQIDKNYKHNPSEEEWQVAKVIKDCLKIFYDATLRFCGTSFPTANIFFTDVCEIHLQLREWEHCEHECLRLMAGPMKLKFVKYWEECSLLLAIAVVLDSRFKLDVVECYYDHIYGIDAHTYIERVRIAFISLYKEYEDDSSDPADSYDMYKEDGSSSSSNLGHHASKNDGSSRFDRFERWYKESRSSNIRAYQKSEVDQYLEEPVFPRTENFNILHWWRMNSAKFPILSKMTHDILAVPATTIALESAFSVGGRVIDESRSCLLPEIVEALVTTDDWIESRKKKDVEENEVEDIAK